MSDDPSMNPLGLTDYRFLSVTRKFQDKRGTWHGLEKKGWVRNQDYETLLLVWYGELKKQQDFIVQNE